MRCVHMAYLPPGVMHAVDTEGRLRMEVNLFIDTIIITGGYYAICYAMLHMLLSVLLICALFEIPHTLL